jgi:transcriptional regulator with XRE-family HTH domain
MELNTMAISNEVIGRTIGKIRKMKRVTQRTIADKTGLTVNHLSLIENGQRSASLDAINQIASAMDVPVEFILILAGDGKTDGSKKAAHPLMDATKGAIQALFAAETSASK